MNIINIGTWNLESDDSDANFLANQILENNLFKYDIWGFSEVKNKKVLDILTQTFTNHSGNKFSYFIGDTKNNDKLGIVYNTEKYELLKAGEIDTTDLGNPNHRDTLLGYFKQIESGKDFTIAVNHLARGNRESRLEQVKIFNLWSIEEIKKGNLIFAIGDYNFDWDIKLKKGNRSFDTFMAYNIYDWIMPEELIATNLHKKYNSILDFIFYADPNETIVEATSHILLKDISKDTPWGSDHRPVIASIKVQE
ncbi:endonuclease/exonuclease/phosphatase family protein [Clostridium taeniosporum]|uniref:Endonuclease/exonuclease/phosphatase domain-containing protein n=1 Tax=Clostridium taeniosporum TaxID=394958 RepID=A0A1D7XP87_9CLOT|nr:endonuclease/exonuclease/phosphatase family protein [Clostridium taeniosporum]AOR25145.1 hypothetical protein BGI42_15515 [Clostridium taeniosporum]